MHTRVRSAHPLGAPMIVRMAVSAESVRRAPASTRAADAMGGPSAR